MSRSLTILLSGLLACACSVDSSGLMTPPVNTRGTGAAGVLDGAGGAGVSINVGGAGGAGVTAVDAGGDVPVDAPTDAGASTGGRGSGGAGSGVAGAGGSSGGVGGEGGKTQSGSGGSGSGGSGSGGSGSGGSGSGGSGSGGSPGSLVVGYVCPAAQPREAMIVRLRLLNASSQSLPLTDVTLRYWFSSMSFANLRLACDYGFFQFGADGCANIMSSSSFKAVAPPRPGATAYLEVGFDAAAGTLEAHHDDPNDQLLLRIFDSSFAVMDQTDDYSANCSTPDVEIITPLVTAYVKGVLVSGTEPR